jgi:hypothetical protein
MNNQQSLTISMKQKALELMTVASDNHHPGWRIAIDRLCDIERGLTCEARNEFFNFLSELNVDGPK